ncbi:aldehyde oxidase and xanthine dehydrogenase a/b hammerhead [Spirochaeta thermophila DSM 6578]|uniref:Aldehyde oxidase and xanthine dehydrogenase a/b hammerhead n=1 Tax=Winmispira thermophila (strain ATCC 700085 / DSM 6578 / Z-1203) TaxID=869211 RepID=G0GFS9_WINT7|nr:molybdopterin cofactor-binding domain-containing protein [Spirochaeta thermophila]AEJ61622.1 aldehyde oxidase and xanthine dehydrogenase a/b hammerhead [Spirochaeta thermophila DSM 6578]
MNLRDLRTVLTGGAEHPLDLSFPGMLHVGILRSTRAHAKIREIQIPQDIPPDINIIRAADLPRPTLTILDEEIPLLAEDKVFYEGQPILLVVAPSSREMREILSRIQVTYEELPATISLEEALGHQIAHVRTATRGPWEEEPETEIIRGRILVPSESLPPLREEAIVTHLADGVLHIATTCPWPSLVRETVARVCGKPSSKIHVNLFREEHLYDADVLTPLLCSAYAAFVTCTTGRPCRLQLSPHEMSRYGSKAPSVLLQYTAWIARNAVRKVDLLISIDAGYIAPFSREMVDRAFSSILSLYRWKSMRLTIRAVRTNLLPTGFFAGLGDVPIARAVEGMMNHLALKAGASPEEWRLTHLRGDPSFDALRTLVREATRKADFPRKFTVESITPRTEALPFEPRRGTGLAVAGLWHGFFSFPERWRRAALSLSLETDGTLVVRSTHLPQHPELRDVWISLIKEYTGISEGKITFSFEGASDLPAGGPSSMGRNVRLFTGLLVRACRELQQKRFRTPLPIHLSVYARGTRVKPTAQGYHLLPPSEKAWGVGIVEVRAIPLTHVPRIVKIWLCIDAGHILSPEALRRVLIQNTLTALSMRRSSWERDLYPDISLPNIEIHFFPSQNTVPLPAGNLPFALIPPALDLALLQLHGEGSTTLIQGEEHHVAHL